MTASAPPTARTGAPAERALELLTTEPRLRTRVTHVHQRPGRAGRPTDWPTFVPAALVGRLAEAGIRAPWEHQARAAGLVWRGAHTVLATGTASGKSLAYQLPVLSAMLTGDATALYLAPTKALAADQCRTVDGFGLPGVRAACYDGDCDREGRAYARRHANLLLTNPDMLHRSLLPGHFGWASFLRRLRFVVVDECHAYRGVFGSHVSAVLRRLRRVAAYHGSDPTFLFASATTADPQLTAARLSGLPVAVVDDDASPSPPTTVLLWDPPPYGPAPARAGRRPAVSEAADLTAELVSLGARTLAFVRSRRAAEGLALATRRALANGPGAATADPASAPPVAAYRAGYLPEERRALERALDDGALLAMASTSALELGIDVRGLDVVVLAGYPGSIASMWQRVGRAGRSGSAALAVLVAGADPLDTYLVHHPEALFGRPVEATVLDPDNRYVLAPHLAAAAAELPLTDADLPLFGRSAAPVVAELVASGLLRRRPAGWYWTRRGRAADRADLRGGLGEPVRLVESGTGRVLGTADRGRAPAVAHAGAVYVHQGATYLVRRLDLGEGVALVVPAEVDYTTTPRSTTEVSLRQVRRYTGSGDRPELGEAGVGLWFGDVEVSTRVVGFLRRAVATGKVLGEYPLDLPPRQLSTQAVWWTVEPRLLVAAGLPPARTAGAVHAAEHAAIALFPWVATCDDWDVAGMATVMHPDTGLPTVVIYDGQPGGAGFAEQGYRAARRWLTAAREAIAVCACDSGCPSCLHSARCGRGNDPLDKAGAVLVFDVLLSGLADGPDADAVAG